MVLECFANNDANVQGEWVKKGFDGEPGTRTWPGICWRGFSAILYISLGKVKRVWHGCGLRFGIWDHLLRHEAKPGAKEVIQLLLHSQPIKTTEKNPFQPFITLWLTTRAGELEKNEQFFDLKVWLGRHQKLKIFVSFFLTFLHLKMISATDMFYFDLEREFRAPDKCLDFSTQTQTGTPGSMKCIFDVFLNHPHLSHG